MYKSLREHRRRNLPNKQGGSGWTLIKHVVVVFLVFRVVVVLDLLPGPARPLAGRALRGAQAVVFVVVFILIVGRRFLGLLRGENIGTLKKKLQNNELFREGCLVL